jgi:hypothetical protein
MGLIRDLGLRSLMIGVRGIADPSAEGSKVVASSFRCGPQSLWSSKEIKAEQQFKFTLSQVQLQVLEIKNHSMLEGFEKKLDQIKYHLILISLLMGARVQKKLYQRYRPSK